MPWIVDGDNVLGRDRTDVARRDLARKVRELARREGGRRIVLVFDGPDTAPGLAGPDVVFAGRRSADAVIQDLLGREPDRGGWTVFTDDRSLGDRCRWLGARRERKAAFLAKLEGTGAGDERGAPPDVSDIEKAWLEGEEKD